MRLQSLVFILIIMLSACGAAEPAASPPTAVALVPATATAAPTLPPPTATPIAVPAPAGRPTLVYLERADDNTTLQVLALGSDGEPRLIQELPCGRACEGQPALQRVPGERAVALVIDGPVTSRALHSINIDTGADKIVVTNVGGESVAFSPDGSQVAFVRHRKQPRAPIAESSIWAINRTTGEVYQVTGWTFFLDSLHWYDNDELFFSQPEAVSLARWTTWRVLMSDDQPQSLAGNGQIVGLFADRSAYMAVLEELSPQGSPTGGHALGMVSLTTGEVTLITGNIDDPELSFSAHMSPDRRRVALFHGESGKTGILGVAGGIGVEGFELDLPPGAAFAWDERSERLLYWEGDALLAAEVATGAVAPVLVLRSHPVAAEALGQSVVIFE